MREQNPKPHNVNSPERECFLKNWLCKSFLREHITAIYMIIVLPATVGDTHTPTHTTQGSSNMHNSSHGQRVFPKMTPTIPDIPARCVKIPQCCHRNTHKDIVLTKGHPLTYTGSRSLPCIQRQKKSTDHPDARSHLLIGTAALTDEGRHNCLYDITCCIKTQRMLL